MIKGYVKIVNQTSYTELPEPLEWEIVRADKADRDSFYYVFPFDPALRQTLCVQAEEACHLFPKQILARHMHKSGRI